MIYIAAANVMLTRELGWSLTSELQIVLESRDLDRDGATMIDNPLRQRLAESVNTGEVIKIVYHGGPHSGSVREVSPISISESELYAHDLATGIQMLFKISEMKLADSATVVPTFESKGSTSPPSDIHSADSEIISDAILDLASMGLRVNVKKYDVSRRRHLKSG